MKFHKLPNFTLPMLNAKAPKHPPTVNPKVNAGPMSQVFGTLNPNDTNLGPVIPVAEGSPVNGAWEQQTNYKGYPIETKQVRQSSGNGYSVRVGGSGQVCAGVVFPDKQSAVNHGRSICDYWETGTPPSPPTGSNVADDGTLRNAGTKEGFTKAQDTLSAKGAKANADAAEHYKNEAVKHASGRFAKGRKPDLDKALKAANLATGCAVVADAAAKHADSGQAYDHAKRAHQAAAAAHKAARGGAKGDHGSPSRTKEAEHLKSSDEMDGLKKTISTTDK